MKSSSRCTSISLRTLLLIWALSFLPVATMAQPTQAQCQKTYEEQFALALPMQGRTVVEGDADLIDRLASKFKPGVIRLPRRKALSLLKVGKKFLDKWSDRLKEVGLTPFERKVISHFLDQGANVSWSPTNDEVSTNSSTKGVNFGYIEDTRGLNPYQILIHELTHIYIGSSEDNSVFYLLMGVGGSEFGRVNVLREEIAAYQGIFDTQKEAYEHVTQKTYPRLVPDLQVYGVLPKDFEKYSLTKKLAMIEEKSRLERLWLNFALVQLEKIYGQAATSVWNRTLDQAGVRFDRAQPTGSKASFEKDVDFLVGILAKPLRLTR